MSLRTEKVASVIKRALSMPVSELARQNLAGIATVTTVRMSPDLTLARIYVSVYGGKISAPKFIALLEDSKFELRKIVGQSVRLRFTPDLRFFIDDTLDQIDHIQQLIDKAKAEDSKIKNTTDE